MIFNIFNYLKRRKADKLKARFNAAYQLESTPTVEGRLTYIDIGKLTSAQAAVLLENHKFRIIFLKDHKIDVLRRRAKSDVR